MPCEFSAGFRAVDTSFAMSTPLAAQCSAARRQVARTSSVALCHGGSVELLRSLAENGAAFKMPTPLAFR